MTRVLRFFRSYFRRADTLLLILCLAASVFGVVLISSASRSYETNRYVLVQIAAIALGLFLYLLFTLLDIDLLGDRWYLLVLFNLGLLAALKLWGVEGETGNRSWLRFGGIGIQPSELLKITFSILLARQMARLSQSRKGLSSVVSVLQIVVHFLLIFGLIVLISADMGSALVFLFILIAMCFAAGLHILWFLAAAAAAAAAAPILWNKLLSDYQRNRILATYYPDQVDPDGLGITWQARQSKIALASGGISGQGLGQGTRSQSDLLPFKHTDFIFSVAGEELGLIGCGIIVLLLTAIILRIIVIGMRSGNQRDLLLCAGLAGMLTFQVFENIGMCVGLTPVIGVTLPFFSYGGSSIVTSFAAAGIVSGVRFRKCNRDMSSRLE